MARIAVHIEVPDHQTLEALGRAVQALGGRIISQPQPGLRQPEPPAVPAAGNGNVVRMPARRRQYVGADPEGGPEPDGGGAA